MLNILELGSDLWLYMYFLFQFWYLFLIWVIAVWLYFSLMNSYLIMVTEPTLLHSDFRNILGFDLLTGEKIVNYLTAFFLSFPSTDRCS